MQDLKSTMLDLNDLWIGERIITIEGRLIGTFEGRKDNEIILFKYNNQVFTKHISEFELAPEEELVQQLTFNEDQNKQSKELNVHHKSAKIDLHIEVLAPHLSNAIPARILQYQKERFTQFIADCIRNRLPNALIIHGKGEGVLRQEIRHMISLEPKIKLQISVNHDGATEIWFNS